MKTLRPAVALLAAGLAVFSTTIIITISVSASAATSHASYTSTGCYNLDCSSSATTPVDGPGPILTHPVVYLVRFSASKRALKPAGGFVQNTFNHAEPNAAGAILASLSPYSAASWWMHQYSRSGVPIRYGRVGGTITLYDPTLATSKRVSDAAIDSELLSATFHHLIPRAFDDVFVLFFRSNQLIVAPGGANSRTTFCAYHSYVPYHASTINYVVMPNEASSSGCGYGIGLGPFNAETVHLSHELAEAVTDPSSVLAWATPTNDEISDLCESGASPVYTARDLTVAYVFQYVYALFPGGCFGLPVPTTLTPFPVSGPTLPVALSMNANGAVLAQPLTLYEGSTPIASTTTSSSGQASFSSPLLASLPAGTELTVTFAGSGPLDASAVTFLTEPAGTASPTLGITLPTTLPAAHLSQLGVSLDPSTPLSVTLSSPFSQSATTDSSGHASFSFAPPPGRSTYQVSASFGQASLTLSLSVPTV